MPDQKTEKPSADALLATLNIIRRQRDEYAQAYNDSMAELELARQEIARLSERQRGGA